MKYDHRFEAEAEETGKPREPDRWKLLALITETRRALGLGQRDINVLRALYSFVPKGETIGVEKIVFPSNHRLAERAGGLSERTLRRAISRLVEIGLIARRDSATRKRFSIRRRSGDVIAAFGFDIAPAFLRMRELLGIATALADDAARQAMLREDIRILRSTLVLREEDAIELDRALRRRLTVEALESLRADLRARIQADKMTVTNGQSDRLVNNNSDIPQKKGNDAHISSTDLPIITTYFPEIQQTDCDKSSIAMRMGGFLGLTHSDIDKALRRRGSGNILRLLDQMAESIEDIKDPCRHFAVLTEGQR